MKADIGVYETAARAIQSTVKLLNTQLAEFCSSGGEARLVVLDASTFNIQNRPYLHADLLVRIPIEASKGDKSETR